MLIYPSTAAVFEQAAAKSRRNYQYDKIYTSKAHCSDSDANRCKTAPF